MPAKPVTVMGREFDTLDDAIHWVQIGIKLAQTEPERYRLIRQLLKLKNMERKENESMSNNRPR